jgi:hypothetical protein
MLVSRCHKSEIQVICSENGSYYICSECLRVTDGCDSILFDENGASLHADVQ